MVCGEASGPCFYDGSFGRDGSGLIGNNFGEGARFGDSFRVSFFFSSTWSLVFAVWSGALEVLRRSLIALILNSLKLVDSCIRLLLLLLLLLLTMMVMVMMAMLLQLSLLLFLLILRTATVAAAAVVATVRCYCFFPVYRHPRLPPP